MQGNVWFVRILKMVTDSWPLYVVTKSLPIEATEEQLSKLQDAVNPLSDSINFGINLYVRIPWTNNYHISVQCWCEMK